MFIVRHSTILAALPDAIKDCSGGTVDGEYLSRVVGIVDENEHTSMP
jgi:hypothetical protein